MERLEEYIAFDLEFNQHEGQTIGPTATINSSSYEGSRKFETRVGPSKRRSSSYQKRLFCSLIWRKIKKLFGLFTNLIASFIIYGLN